MGDLQELQSRPHARTRSLTSSFARAIWASLIAAAVLLASVAAAGATTVSGGRQGVVLAADAQAGASVFANNCARCHGPKGEGGVGPSLAAAAFPGLVAPKVQVGGRGMPAFGGKLSATQIGDVAAYVAQQLADPAARTASVADGGVLFRLYCSGCHGTTGRGGALVEGKNAPSLKGRPAANALAAVIRGPRNMPVFTGTLDVRQQASVARYVQAAIDDPASPGGWGLGFIGPVVEGVVSWAALVVLIFIAVWLAWKKGDVRDA